MAGHLKSTRRLRHNRPRAAAQLKHPAALAAVEVMVVRLTRQLVTCRLAGQRDWIEPSLGQQRFDIPVHGGDAQRFIVALRGAQRLLGRKRAICLNEGIADGLLLARVARDWMRHSF